MRGFGNSEAVLCIATADSTKIAIDGKPFSIIQTRPDEVRLHQKIRRLRLQPGEMCWCRITDIPRLSKAGWRAVIVHTDNGDLAVVSDMTSQLVFLSR